MVDRKHYLMCPDCGSTVMWSRNKQQRVEFRLRLDQTPEPLDEGDPLPEIPVEWVYCRDCSWKGAPESMLRGK